MSKSEPEPIEVKLELNSYVPTQAYYDNLVSALYYFTEQTTDIDKVNLQELSEYIEALPRDMQEHIKDLLKETKSTVNFLLALLKLIEQR